MGRDNESSVSRSAGEAGPVDRVIERLASLQRPDGGWPYEPGQQTSFTEPTCWTLLALHTAGRLTPATTGSACSFLRSVQLPDGGFHSGAVGREADWSTTLAVFCLLTIEAEPEAARRGVQWLLGFEGWHDAELGQGMFAHDTTIRGWPWLADCHSWIEPTSYAIYALKRAGLADHPRVTEATRMILNRAISSGGWNYGNTWVLGTELRPFPSTTGVALIALAGAGDGPEARRGLRYLGRALPRLRTSWALAWTALTGRYYGFETFEAPEPVDVDRRIAACLQDQLQPTCRLRVHELAVLAMSALGRDRLPFPGDPGLSQTNGATATANEAGVKPGS